MTDNLTFLSRMAIEIIHIKFVSTHAEFLIKLKIAEWSNVKEITNMSTSEVVVIESTSIDSITTTSEVLIFVREHLRCLYYLDILKKFLLLQRKHSKCMYAKCLNFPCFIKKNWLHACTRVDLHKKIELINCHLWWYMKT